LEFKHSQTKFPLRGRHTEVDCADCHETLVFSDAPQKCQDCHADLHRRKNGAECELCHNPNGWQVSIHNINEHQDRFPLIGAPPPRLYSPPPAIRSAPSASSTASDSPPNALAAI